MRIHRLRLKGIGPFADEQVIEFDELSQQGLFLLDGATGVGKSTIVDAIVFALFSSPATEGGEDRMVSDFLGDDIAKANRPFVELTFSTSEGTFRIRREPKAPYVKRSGAPGMHNASVRLVRLPNEAAEEGTLVSTSAQEVGAEVSRLLGLNRDQVLSTIVLAQGQFARFLKARTEDRRAILQSVFNTQRYEQVQNALIDARKAAYAQRDDSRRALIEALAAFVEASGFAADPREFGDSYADDPQACQALLDLHVEDLGAQVVRLESESALCQDSEQKAAAALDAGRHLSERIVAKRELLAQQVDLESQAAAVEALASALEQARAAALVWAAELPLQERTREYDEARSARRDAVADLPTDQQDLSAADLEALVTHVAAERAGLADVLAVEAGLDDRRSLRDELRADVDRLTERLAQCTEQLDELPATIERAKQTHEALVVRAAQLPIDRKDLAEAAAAEELLLRVDRLREEAARVKAQQLQATELEHVAQATLAAARQRYKEGLAAELAAGLQDGEGCPVCGSVQHPMPAQPTVDHTDAERIEELEQQWRDLNRQAQTATSLHASTVAELHSQEALLRWTDHEEVNLARKRAAERVEGGLQAERDLVAVRTALDSLEADLRRLQDQRIEDGQRLAAQRQSYQQVVTSVEADLTRVRVAREGFSSVAERDRHLNGVRRRLETAVRARLTEEAIAHSLSDSRGSYLRALADSVFEDEAAYRAARQSPQWIREVEEQLNLYDKTCHAVRKQLGSLDDVDEGVHIDLPALQHAAAVAKEAADACLAELATARKVHERAASTNRGVLAAWRAGEAVERSTAPVIRLADLVSGQHGKVKLATYVVKRRFADVVDAANAHLATMSDGRYRLEPSDGPSGSERISGLSLDVYDDRTDAPRSPATLSGGETFYVSLSLALGLADVVQSESGGISIDTLFVDEGFGSLDADTLDTVMEVLTSLSRGHRTVGLISHVEEMKRRIPDRVEIHRLDPNGPSQVKVRAS